MLVDARRNSMDRTGIQSDYKKPHNMRVSKKEPLQIFCISLDGSLVASLFNSYASVADAVQAAKQHLSNHHHKGVYQVNIYQDGKAWNRTVKA